MNNSENRTMWGGMMEDLVTGIEHLKKAKAHMSKANTIMSDSISKLKALEEENARLKAELDDWKGNAEGFQPDAYMKLPLDGDGVPIRIGDKVNVDGDAMTVIGYRLYNGTLLIIVKESGSNITYSPKPSSIRHFKYTPSDSWEKLEECEATRMLLFWRRPRKRVELDDHGAMVEYGIVEIKHCPFCGRELEEK